MAKITDEEVEELRQQLSPLIGVQFELLKIPVGILKGFEPSQIGSMIGALMDACIPQLAEILPDDETLRKVGLTRHPGQIGEREAYPDYLHSSGKRVELKLLYVNPIGVEMKRPPTPREPSARITQKVTRKNVDEARDVLLVVAYQLQPNKEDEDLYSPTINDLGIFPMIDCVLARDMRHELKGGKWFGDYETPVVISRIGSKKLKAGVPLDTETYGRKKDEGKDLNEDTNFGKLHRVPYEPLQRFCKKHGAEYAAKGCYPEPWVIADDMGDIAKLRKEAEIEERAERIQEAGLADED